MMVFLDEVINHAIHGTKNKGQLGFLERQQPTKIRFCCPMHLAGLKVFEKHLARQLNNNKGVKSRKLYDTVLLRRE